MAHRRWAVTALAVLTLLVAPAAESRAVVRSTPDVAAQFNSAVRAVAASGDRVFVGGDFTRAGVPTGRGADLGRADGVPNFAFAKPNAQVFAVVADGSGGWFIGGGFTRVGSVARNRLAHLLSDGSVDPRFDPNVDLEVTKLALSGGTLFAAGNFTTVNGGLARSGLAAFDTTTGAATAFDPRVPASTIRAIAVAGGALYAGGTFTTVGGGVVRNGLAAFDTATGTATSFDPNVSGTVSALEVAGTTLYAGGAFTSVNGSTARNRLAAFDTATGAATAFDPDADGPVAALAIEGGTIYAGGFFTTVNGSVARTRLAALDRSTGAALASFHPDVGASIRSLAAAGGTVYVGGTFDTVAGTVARHGIAAFDAADGAVVTGFDPDPDGGTETIAVAGTRVYIGGGFAFVGARTIHEGLAAVTLDGAIDPSFHASLANVYALAAAGGKVYAGGYFTTVGAAPRKGLAAFDAATGTLDGAFDPSVGGIAFSGVSALAIAGGKVYAGGNFTTVNGATARRHLAAFDLATGVADPAFNPDPGDRVYALALSGGAVYAGGEFRTVNGSAARDFLAAFDPATGVARATFDPRPNGTVNALALDGSTLYAGGQFSAVNGAVARSRLAAFDTATGGVVAGFDPGADAIVRALAVSGPTLYAGGDFSVAGATTRRRLAAFDRAGGVVDPGFDPNLPAGVVTALVASGSRLYAGGAFDTVGSTTTLRFAQFSEPAPPQVVSGAASSATPSGASVAGTVDPRGSQTAYVFEYGPTLAFGAISDPAPAGSGDGPVSVSASLTGLAPTTTIYYRIVATSAAGTTFGAVRSFNTTGAAQAPVAITLPEVSAGDTSATVAGQVNPSGSQTAFTFEYGPSLSFGAISTVVALDDAIALEPVGATLTGLSPGTTYYYRVVATNATGTGTGVVRSFTTTGAGTLARARMDRAHPRGMPTLIRLPAGPRQAVTWTRSIRAAIGLALPTAHAKHRSGCAWPAGLRQPSLKSVLRSWRQS